MAAWAAQASELFRRDTLRPFFPSCGIRYKSTLAPCPLFQRATQKPGSRLSVCTRPKLHAAAISRQALPGSGRGYPRCAEQSYSVLGTDKLALACFWKVCVIGGREIVACGSRCLAMMSIMLEGSMLQHGQMRV
jgi:hypothetical protein